MNRFFRIALLVLMSAIGMSVMAQESAQIPVDPKVRIGKLSNGLTYYIRHNDYPKGQAEFYIAQKVGSIMEEDNQRGLAHFLEHMCFNGTKSFPGNNLVQWCESVGIKFGYNLNAYTSIERTVYNISGVPTARESVQDSCLLILHDWANDLLLDEKEIDAERSVIHEEWRSQMSPQQRVMEKLLPIMYPNSRYGYRLPIGIMDVVDNFPYQALRDYYETWYRPDLQGIMIVGDIDEDRIEAKVKELFGSIEMPANAPERTVFTVEDNEAPIIAIGTDKEVTNRQCVLMFKHDAVTPEQKSDINYLVLKYVTGMASMMLNSRLSEMSNKPDAPFAGAYAYDGNFFVCDTKGAFNASVVAKTDIKAAVESVYREVLRAKRHGFVATEYVRAREEYLSSLQQNYNNRNKVESSKYVNECVEHFLDNEPMPGIETEYQMMNMVAKQIPVEAVTQTFQTLVNEDRNMVVMMILPEKEGEIVPTEAEMLEIIKKVDAEEIAPFVDNVKQEPLVENLPAKGKIVKETTDKLYDTKQWTLSNGAKVILKKTDFKDDEVLFGAIAKGGSSVYPESEADNLKVLPVIMNQPKLGTYNSSDLEKYMAGKQAGVSLSISDYTRGLNGFSTPKDLKTLMELVYMHFTAYDIDADEYAATMSALEAMLKQSESTPKFIFSQKRAEALYPQARNQSLTSASLAKADRARMVEMVKESFSNAADFTFTFVGNYDEAELRELVEQYIATIPGNAKKATKKITLAGLGVTRGTYVKEYSTKMEVPQVYTAMSYVGDMPYTVKNVITATIAGQVMSTRLLEKVREKEGATYSIGAGCSLSRISDDRVTFRTAFPMKPEKKDVVFDIIKKEFKAMTGDVTAAEVQKVREFLVKQYDEDIKQNSTWRSSILNYEVLPVDVAGNYKEVLNTITEKDVMNFVAALIKQGNFNVVFLNPETEGK